MIVVCKNFPRNVNGFEVISDPNITINKSYTVLDYMDDNWKPVKINKDEIISLKKLKMLGIMGNKGECSYWSDYFYNEKELRKIKLKKLKTCIG